MNREIVLFVTRGKKLEIALQCNFYPELSASSVYNYTLEMQFAIWYTVPLITNATKVWQHLHKVQLYATVLNRDMKTYFP